MPNQLFHENFSNVKSKTLASKSSLTFDSTIFVVEIFKVIVRIFK